MKKVVELKHVEALMELIEERDSYCDWSKEYEKIDNKVKRIIEWLKRNAIDVEEKHEDSGLFKDGYTVPMGGILNEYGNN